MPASAHGARRFPLGAALTGCAVAVALFLLLPRDQTPLGLVRLFAGADTARIDVVGGTVVQVEVEDGDPRAAEQAVRARLARSGRGFHIVREGRSLHVGIFEAEPDDAEALVHGASGSGSFALHVVEEDTPFMRSVYRRVESEAPDLAISGGVDLWSHDASGQQYTDYYLTSADRHLLEAHVRSIEPEPGRVLAIENLPGGAARTYYLDAEPRITGDDIESAEVYWNPTTQWPEVLVTFTRDGGRRFGELTSEVVGRKIAIVVNGRVTSAPVVQAAITGGRMSVTPDTSRSEAEMHAEAETLAATLGMAPLDARLRITGAAANPARVGAPSLLLASGLLALLVGLASFVLVASALRLADRFVLMRRGAPSSGERTRPWLRLAVTVAGPALAVAGYHLVLPTLDTEHTDLLFTVDGPSFSLSMREQLSVFALGLMPVLSAFVLVELAALAVPAWRRHRETAGGRARLVFASLILGAVFALVQGGFLATWLHSFGGSGGAMGPAGPSTADAGVVALTALTLAAGTFVLVVMARIIGDHGLGNGFSVLLTTGLIAATIDSGRFLRDSPQPPRELVILAGGIVVAAVATACVLRVRVRGYRLPTAGIVPIGWALAVMQLVTLAAWLGAPAPLAWLDAIEPTSPASLAATGALVAALAALLSYAFCRARPHEPANLVTTAYLLLLVAVAYAMRGGQVDASGSIVPVALTTAIVMDVAREWRGRSRHPSLVPVCDLHRVREVDAAVDALRHAGIPVMVRGASHRALLHVFAPFVPITIFAPREHADEARRILDAMC